MNPLIFGHWGFFSCFLKWTTLQKPATVMRSYSVVSRAADGPDDVMLSTQQRALMISASAEPSKSSSSSSSLHHLQLGHLGVIYCGDQEVCWLGCRFGWLVWPHQPLLVDDVTTPSGFEKKLSIFMVKFNLTQKCQVIFNPELGQRETTPTASL